MSIDQLYEQAKAINPEVRFVTEEANRGDLESIPQRQYWIHTHSKAFTGDSPDEVLADLLSSVSTREAA